MSRLWDKGGDLDASVARLTVGNDPELDLVLVRYDALASAAHATMLWRPSSVSMPTSGVSTEGTVCGRVVQGHPAASGACGLVRCLAEGRLENVAAREINP